MPNFRAIGLFSGALNMKNITNSDWRVTPDFPDYAVTPDGQVWSFKSKKFLKPMPNKQKYLTVELRNSLKRKNCSVHRLVGKAFVKLPKKFNGNYDIATINHKDHNKANNHYTNLEWVTREDNAQEAWDNGYMDHMKKPCFCVSIEDKKYTDFDSTRRMARSLNLPRSTVANTINQSDGILQGKYIVGYVEDFDWSYLLQDQGIDAFIQTYSDTIANYKSMNRGPKKITNLQTGESKRYNSLSEFAKENGLDPNRITRYLRNHSDLYKVGPA